MSQLNDLKAQAFDKIREMEAHTNRAQQLKQEVQSISQKIAELEAQAKPASK